MAAATYNDLTLSDTRSTFTDGTDGVFFVNVPQTGTEITVNRHFRSRFWKQISAGQGTRFKLAANSSVSVYTTPYDGPDFNDAWPFRPYTNTTAKENNFSVIKVGNGVTDRANVNLFHYTTTGSTNAVINGVELAMLGQARNLTITGAQTGITGFTLPSGSKADVAGSLTIQGTGAAGSGSYLKIGHDGGAPATLILRGDYNAIAGFGNEWRRRPIQ